MLMLIAIAAISQSLCHNRQYKQASFSLRNSIMQLPDDFKNYGATVQVQAQSTDWLSVLEKTAGSIPDLERPCQNDIEDWQTNY
jgi:hypothetical protein